MTTTKIRAPSRALLPLAAVLVLLAAIMTQGLLSPSRASAQCTLTSDEAEYVALLAKGYPEKGIPPIVPAPGATYCDLAFGGHAIAFDLRNGVSPIAEIEFIYEATPSGFTYEMAQWEVACATVVFAPELLPPDIRGGTIA